MAAYTLDLMTKRRVTQIVVGCFMALLLLAPVYESFDRWDGFPKSGDDTVLNLIGAVAFCGLILVAAKKLPPLLLKLFSLPWAMAVFFSDRSSLLSPAFHSSIGESPPLLLLLPLRL